MSDLDPVEAENLLLGFYEEELLNGDGSFADHIGLPRDASWGAFRRHYDKDGLPDSSRAANDLATYPPIARRIAELQAEKELREATGATPEDGLGSR